MKPSSTRYNFGFLIIIGKQRTMPTILEDTGKLLKVIITKEENFVKSNKTKQKKEQVKKSEF